MRNSDAQRLTTLQRDALVVASYWAAQAIWWAHRLPAMDAAVNLGRCLERLEGWTRKLPPELMHRGVQLSLAIERAALLPR